MLSRLSEINVASNPNDLEKGTNPSYEVIEAEDAEIEIATTNQPISFLEQYGEEIKDVEKDIKDLEVKSSLIEIKAKEQFYLLGEDTNALVKQSNQLASNIRVKLGTIEKENQALRLVPGSAEYKIRFNLFNAWFRRFVSVMGNYQRVQLEIKEKNRMLIGRQLRIANPNVTEEEMEKTIETGTNANIFASSLMEEEDEVTILQQRENDIKRIEESVQEINQLFLSMATMVTAQGEVLDQIEHAVSQADAFHEKGNKNLLKAKKHAEKALCRGCCCTICIVLIVIVLIAVIILGVMAAKGYLKSQTGGAL